MGLLIAKMLLIKNSDKFTPSPFPPKNVQKGLELQDTYTKAFLKRQKAYIKDHPKHNNVYIKDLKNLPIMLNL